MSDGLGLVFVFGSNLRGIHGAGAAKDAARFWGARRGCGEGPSGESYAIPTKITPYHTRTLSGIWESVWGFIEYAKGHPETDFQVTAIGCGYAGYKPREIMPMFADAPDNCHLPIGWRRAAPSQEAGR